MGMDLSGKRIVTYARYSSDNQRDASIEDQQRKMSGFIVQHEGDPSAAIPFQDRAVSAASLKRDGFEAMMTLVRAGKVDVIITENIDRLSRDLADSAVLFRELKYLQVPLIGVSNGFNSSANNAQLHFVIEAWKNEQYIEDLRYRTRRGLEGRALKGYSTGGLPIGYASVPEHDAEGEVVGYRIAIDEVRAAIVRRIFDMYLVGMSFEAIAHRLNEENVEPARRGKYRHKGWVASSVRMILHNPAYIGQWTFGKRRWVKVPGTNIRRHRPAPPSEVIVREYPERRIIEQATWEAVQDRLASVRAFYTKTTDGQPKGKALPGKKTQYPLSGVLFCGVCGSRMIIYGGSSVMYYRCADNKKRGICKNALSLREDIARAKILGAIKARYTSPAALAYLRQRIAERLGNMSREVNAELVERRAQLARTNERIRGLVTFIADGDRSASVVDALHDLERQKKNEEAAIAALVARAEAPVRLPSPDDLVKLALDLDRALQADPSRGREALAGLFEGGRLRLEPQPGGFYVARSTIFPLALGQGPLGGGRIGGSGARPARVSPPRNPVPYPERSLGRLTGASSFLGRCRSRAP